MSSSNATTATETEERPALLDRQSYLELDARGRAHSLLDVGTGRELCGPFDRVESPWLEPQGLVPQADDGVVVVKGTLAGEPCVVIGIEQKLLGSRTGYSAPNSTRRSVFLQNQHLNWAGSGGSGMNCGFSSSSVWRYAGSSLRA
jgi:acetyl-CoA carboxylase beta subunit